MVQDRSTVRHSFVTQHSAVRAQIPGGTAVTVNQVFLPAMSSSVREVTDDEYPTCNTSTLPA